MTRNFNSSIYKFGVGASCGAEFDTRTQVVILTPWTRLFDNNCFCSLISRNNYDAGHHSRSSFTLIIGRYSLIYSCWWVQLHLAIIILCRFFVSQLRCIVVLFLRMLLIFSTPITGWVRKLNFALDLSSALYLLIYDQMFIANHPCIEILLF